MVNSRSLAPWPSAPFPVFGTPSLCLRIAYSKRTAEYIIELERYSSLFSLSEQNTPFRFSSGYDTLHTAPHQSHRQPCRVFIYILAILRANTTKFPKILFRALPAEIQIPGALKGQLP